MEESTPKRGPGRPRKSEEAKARERAAILQGARTAVACGGPDVALDEIAAAAGMSKPAIYAHFADKAGLAEALALDLEAEMHSWAVKRVARGGTTDPAGLLRVGVDAFTRFMAEETSLYRFIVRALQQRTDADVLDNALIAAFQARTAAMLAHLYPEMDPDIREVASYACLGQIFTACEGWLQHRRFPRQRLVDILVEIFTTGISSLAADGAAP